MPVCKSMQYHDSQCAVYTVGAALVCGAQYSGRRGAQCSSDAVRTVVSAAVTAALGAAPGTAVSAAVSVALDAAVGAAVTAVLGAAGGAAEGAVVGAAARAVQQSMQLGTAPLNRWADHDSSNLSTGTE